MAVFSTAFLSTALAERDADAFLHAGHTDEPTLRYCAGPLPDGEAAFVYADGRATLCVPPALAAAARSNSTAEGGLTTDVRVGDAPVGERAVAVLVDRGASRVLTPRQVPHDAALYAENAGCDLASTDAVARARARKTATERERIAAAQSAAVAGIERARETLQTAAVGDGRLHRSEDGDEAVTAGSVREAVDAAARANGASPGTETRVTVGGEAAAPDAPVEPGETVVVRVAPREPDGYHGTLARTFVVAGEGGWERRAKLAVERALDSALRELEAGVSASTIREEVLIECGAYGFADDALPETAGHGVGLAARERPDLRSDDPLPAGTVLAITPAVTDPDGGEVALTDLVAVTDDGYESLGTTERSLRP
jgi:Xaa-Pro aminopeptidase